MLNFKNKKNYKELHDRQEEHEYYYKQAGEFYYTFAVRCNKDLPSASFDGRPWGEERPWLQDVVIGNHFYVARAVADAFAKATGYHAWVFDRDENILYTAKGDSAENEN